MTDAFDKCLAIELREEGGFVNLRSDPGGMTNLGVTRTTWEDWTGKPATEAIMRALTPAKVAPLYRERYWNAVSASDLPAPLALCVFDFAVNAGPARAARYLQQIVRVNRDGQIGPKTIAAVQAFVAERGVAEAVRFYQQSRRDYYRALNTFTVFGRGWLARVDRVESDALRMVS